MSFSILLEDPTEYCIDVFLIRIDIFQKYSNVPIGLTLRIFDLNDEPNQKPIHHTFNIQLGVWHGKVVYHDYMCIFALFERWTLRNLNNLFFLFYFFGWKLKTSPSMHECIFIELCLDYNVRCSYVFQITKEKKWSTSVCYVQRRYYSPNVFLFELLKEAILQSRLYEAYLNLSNTTSSHIPFILFHIRVVHWDLVGWVQPCIMAPHSSLLTTTGWYAVLIWKKGWELAMKINLFKI